MLDVKKTYEEGVEAYLKCNYKEALDKLTKASENNYPAADLWLASMYASALGTAKNTETSKKYYDNAARNFQWFFDEAEKTKEPLAQDNLAYCYAFGYGVGQSYEIAVKYYQKAADQGYALSQDNLGIFYHYGRGVPKDCQQAVRYYRMAAGQGYAGAQYTLGSCYEYGNGIGRDVYNAGYYYQLAKNQGHGPAEKSVARLSQQNSEIIAYANARIAYDNKDCATAISLCSKSLNQFLVDNKPAWILLVVELICTAATDNNISFTPTDIETLKNYKTELFTAIKQLPCKNKNDKDELQNQILLAAYNNQGIAGQIFHAPRDTWIPDFFGAGKCKTDSGTLKDIAEELATRGLLKKAKQNESLPHDIWIPDFSDVTEFKLKNLSLEGK